MRALSRVFVAAVLVGAAGSPALARNATPSRLRVRLREDAGTNEFVGNPLNRGRFRLAVSGRVDVPDAAAFGVRIGDLSLDVPLTGGRFSGAITADGVTFSVRARLRGGALAATVRGRVTNGKGSVFGRQLLVKLDQEPAQTIHGLVPASLVFGETTVPLAVGIIGRFDPMTQRQRVGGPRTAADAIDVSIAAAGIVPVETSTRPVILFVPRRRGEGWHGRARGMAISAGRPPELSLATSSGRARDLDDPGVPGADIGDATPQGDGFTALVLPEGAVFQRAFDVAVQMPSGEQTITVRAGGARGLRAQVTRTVTVPDADPPSQLSADWHVLEIRAGRRLWGWGDNTSAQIGEGTTHDPVSPVPLDSPRDVVSAAAGDDFSMAADADGQVWTWGTRDIPGATIWGTPPEIVGGAAHIVAVTAGEWDSLLLDAEGGVWSLPSTRRNPRRVRNIPQMTAVAGGEDGRLALDAKGSVWVLRTFDVTDFDPPAPAIVTGVPKARAISAGSDAVLLGTDGSVWTFGGNAGAAPVRVAVPGRAIAVSAGFDYNLALGGDGIVWAWDAAMAAQPLPDVNGSGVVPVRVADLDGIVTIAAGRGEKSFAVDGDGAVWMWRSIFISAGTEEPVLAPRAFHPGHFATFVIPIGKR